jgi:hypothetical protein
MAQVLEMAHYRVEDVNRPALSGVVLPPATKTFMPFPHDVGEDGSPGLLSMVEDCLNEVGFRFGQQCHGLSHDGMRYFGVIDLLSKRKNTEYTLQLGIRNALDKRFAAGLAFGKRVMVCCNMSFWGDDNTIIRKHTPNIARDLWDRIFNTVQNLEGAAQEEEWRTECYMETPMSDRDAHDLLCRLALTRNLERPVSEENKLPVCVNTSRVEKVLQEWHEPSHDFGDKTVWRFHNAVTESLKGVHIIEMPSRTIRLNKACDEFSGFAPALAA